MLGVALFILIFSLSFLLIAFAIGIILYILDLFGVDVEELFKRNKKRDHKKNE